MNRVNEKTALIQGDDDDYEEEDSAKESFFKRHKIAIILGCCGICCILIVLFVVLFMVFGVPAIAAGIVQNLLNTAEIRIMEIQVLSQEGNVFTVRVDAWLTYDAPVEADGISDPAELELYVEDPADRTNHIFSAYINMPSIATTGTRTRINITSTMTMMDDRAVHLFLEDILVSETITAWIRGEVGLTAHVPIYNNLHITVGLNQSATINGYKDIEFTLNAMYLVYGATDEVQIDFDLTIHNPGVLYLDFPLTLYNTDLGLYYRDVWVGVSHPTSVHMGKTDTVNRIIGTLHRTPENEDDIAEFLSRYMVGETVEVAAKGTGKFDIGLPRTDENPTNVAVDWDLPGITDSLIMDVACPLTDVHPILLILAAEGKLFNPLEFPVSLHEIEFDAYIGHPCNRSVGRVEETFDDGFYFPSKTPVCLTGLQIKLAFDDLLCIGAAALIDLQMWALDGAMVMSVEEFFIRIPFEYGPVTGHIGQCRLDSLSV